MSDNTCMRVPNEQRLRMKKKISNDMKLAVIHVKYISCEKETAVLVRHLKGWTLRQKIHF